MASGREESSMASEKSLIEDRIRVQANKLQRLANCKPATAKRPLNKLNDRRATCYSSIDSGCGAGVTATITTNLNYDYSLDGSCDCSMADDKYSPLNQTDRVPCGNKLSGPQAMVVRGATDKMLFLSRQHQQQDEVDHSHKSAKPLVSSSMSSSSRSSSSAPRAKSSNDQCRIVLTKSSGRDYDSQGADKIEEQLARPDASSHLSMGGKVLPHHRPLKERENWDKNIEFLLAVIGFAVDLGNVWRFPYICYRNGGGAFLIPYTIMFILGGLPIFYLEMSLGQLFSSGCLTVWRRVCPMFKGIGYAMCVLNFFTGLYYNTIISWAVFFFVQSFTLKELPWTGCNNTWNLPDCKTISERKEIPGLWNLSEPLSIPEAETTNLDNVSTPTRDYFEREVLHVHLSSGIDDLGSIRGPLAAYLAIVFICIYFAIWKGVKSTGKAVWITALLPYFVLIPLLIRGILLEGSWLGIKYYLMPDWAKIRSAEVWVEAAKQIYFSLGPGFGTLMALSSYNKFNHDCQRDALIAASVNYFASFISGFVVFSVLGYMASYLHVDVGKVAAEGPGLVFQVYPEGLALMSFSAVWSVLFFLMVITLGIDSTFGGLESVITGLCDEYPRTLRAHRGIFIGFLIIIIYLCSLPTTTYGGNYVIFILESYGTSLSLLFIVLCEVVVVCWIYGTDRFCTDLTGMSGKRPGLYWYICWKYITPSLSLLIFIGACLQEREKFYVLENGSYIYPKWAPKLGLLMTGASVCCVPIYMVYYYYTQTSGSFFKRMKQGCCVEESDRDDEEDRYTDALSVDKIRGHNDIHLDTDI